MKKNNFKKKRQGSKRSIQTILAWKAISELRHGTLVVYDNALSSKNDNHEKEPSDEPDDEKNCECRALELEFGQNLLDYCVFSCNFQE